MNFSSPFFILFLFLYIFFLARSYIFTQVKNRDTEIIVSVTTIPITIQFTKFR